LVNFEAKRFNPDGLPSYSDQYLGYDGLDDSKSIDPLELKPVFRSSAQVQFQFTKKFAIDNHKT
jgi:hypothetical protein